VSVNDAFKLAIRRSPAAWFESFGKIETKGGGVIAPRANYLQRSIDEAIKYCRDQNLPIRLIILKPRQKGCSTFSMAAFYHMLSGLRKRGMVIGGAHFQSDNLFQMLKTYAGEDEFAGENKAKILDREGRWPNGSLAKKQSARNPESGRSWTVECLVATEVARWAEEGVANAKGILSGLLKCVPRKPDTMVILESTAQGASGDFYERYQSAVTLEELKAGKSGFIKIFAPWYRFEDSVMEPADEGIYSEDDYSDREREYAKRFNLTMGQVAWWRWAMREECNGDWDSFQQDYPWDEETAFLKSGRGRFNAERLKMMRERVGNYEIQKGALEFQGDPRENAVVWRRTGNDEAWVIRWEEPSPGCRYLVSADQMTGDSQTSGKDPDNHSVGVWRAGYWGSRGWHPPKLVARLVSNWDQWERNGVYELRWDIDVLEDRLWRLAVYYGKCLIVPEINMDRGLVELLKLRNANLYRREMFNRRQSTTTEAYGFQTNTSTREMIIEGLARAIRECDREGEGVEIPCPVLLDECQNFIVKDNGRSEASQGKHDDTVLEAAIGLATIGGASTYHEKRKPVWVPPDLRPRVREVKNVQYS